jgi:hypothetical protein
VETSKNAMLPQNK